jgi:peptidoglycan/LPS O-acetylase OafA/YrhL
MRLGYAPTLDGVRALAIGGVIGFHYFDQPRAGYLGVDIFFVLSGFLITTLLLREHQDAGRVDLRAFFVRRARRLLPALLVVLSLMLWVAIVGSVESRSLQPLADGLEQFVIGVFYVANYVAAWASSALQMQVLWSLAMEEQFYLVWPLILLIVLRKRVRPMTLFVGLLAAVAAVWGFRLILWLHGAGVAHLYYTPEVASDSILLGCAAAVAYVHGFRVLGWMRPFTGIALVAVALYLVLGPSRLPAEVSAVGWPLWKTPFSILVAVAICGTVQSASRIARVLSLPPLVFTGRISYGLYLWHTIFLSAFAPLIALPLTFATAATSYHFVERRFLSRTSRGGGQSRVVAPVAAPAGSRAIPALAAQHPQG